MQDSAQSERQQTPSPEDLNEDDIVDVTTLHKPPSLSSWNADLDPGLGNHDEGELALESWMREMRGRIDSSPPIRRTTEDDVWSENFGPAKISRDLKWFYHDRLSRLDAASTPKTYRSPCHKALLKSGLNAQPIPSVFASEISAKVRLDVSPAREPHTLSVHANSWR